MTAFAYKRPFAEPKGCISERQRGRSDKRVFWELPTDHLMRNQQIGSDVGRKTFIVRVLRQGTRRLSNRKSSRSQDWHFSARFRGAPGASFQRAARKRNSEEQPRAAIPSMQQSRPNVERRSAPGRCARLSQTPGAQPASRSQASEPADKSQV